MDLKDLIEQKEEIEKKLVKLEEIKIQIKPQIYEKIKREYQEKINNILEEIKKDQGYLKEQLESIKKTKSQFVSELEKFDLEIEELNVRKLLSDISEEDYNTKKNELEEKRSHIMENIKSFEEKENEISQFIGTNNVNEGFKEKIIYDDNLVYPESKMEQNQFQQEDSMKEQFLSGVDLQPPVEKEPTPLDNIIQPDIVKEQDFDLGKDLPKNEKLVKNSPLETNNSKPQNEGEEIFEKDFDMDLSGENVETIEGLVCPKCGHVNRSDLFNCEKCGAELL